MATLIGTPLLSIQLANHMAGCNTDIEQELKFMFSPNIRTEKDAIFDYGMDAGVKQALSSSEVSPCNIFSIFYLIYYNVPCTNHAEVSLCKVNILPSS